MFRIVRAAAVRIAAIAAVLVVIGRAAPAHADNVATLIRQLAEDSSDKVRLSAALNLTKLGDPRAILPFVKALGNDTEATVRGAAAVGLGKLVTDKTAPSVKRLAINTLTQAGKTDPDPSVRSEAQKALQGIDGGGGGGGGTPPQTPPQTPQTPPTSASTYYVNIGPMASKAGNPTLDARLKGVMVKTASSTMKVASRIALTWPGGGVPTQAMLAAQGMGGCYVDGTVTSVQATGSGASMTVSCKINMLLASFPAKNISAVLNGGGSIQSSGTKDDLAADCVTAVVEDLIKNKIVPTIQSKGCP